MKVKTFNKILISNKNNEQKINKVLINKNKSGIVNAIFFERNNFMKKSLYIYYDTILRNIKSFFSCMIMELKIAK